MAQKLSREDAFTLLQETFIKECKTFYLRDKPEREITLVIRKVEQCKSLEELVRCIVDTETVDLLGIYATAFIEGDE